MSAQKEVARKELGATQKPAIRPRRRTAAAMPAIAPIEHNIPLHERVYRSLRRSLMSGHFQPGQKLSTRSVADLLQVSPMPVRAALGRLHAERALLLECNGTAIVPTLDVDRLKEVMELRVLLEGRATGLATTRMSPAEMLEFDTYAKRLLATLRGTDTQRYLEANADFKLFIYTCARSPALLALIESLWLQHGPYMHQYGRDHHFQAQHGILTTAIEALKARKPAEARTAIRRDIRDGLDHLMATLDFKA